MTAMEQVAFTPCPGRSAGGITAIASPPPSPARILRAHAAPLIWFDRLTTNGQGNTTSGPLFPLAPVSSMGQGMIGNRCPAHRHSCPRAGIQKGAGGGWMPACAGTTTLRRSRPAHVVRQAQHERAREPRERAERLRNAGRLVYVALFP